MAKKFTRRQVVGTKREFRRFQAPPDIKEPKPFFSEMRWIALIVAALIGLSFLRDRSHSWGAALPENLRFSDSDVKLLEHQEKPLPPRFDVPIPPRERLLAQEDEQTLRRYERKVERKFDRFIPIDVPKPASLSMEEALERYQIEEESNSTNIQ